MEKATKKRTRTKAAATTTVADEVVETVTASVAQVRISKPETPAPPHTKKGKKKKTYIEDENKENNNNHHQEQREETSAQAETKTKRSKRVKAKDVIAEIERETNEGAAVKDEEYTEAERKKAVRKTRKGRGAKKQESNETEQEEQKVVISPVKIQQLVKESENDAEEAKKPTTKKRGRKAAVEKQSQVEEARSEPEIQQAQPRYIQIEEQVIQKEVHEEAKINEQIQPPKDTTPVSRTRSRTRSRTMTINKENPTSSLLNKTQDMPDNIEARQSQNTVVIEHQSHPPQQTEVAQPASSKKPKIGGGARITRPKETIAIVKAVVTDDNHVVEQVEKKVVEIVRREAGPRIVKPPEAILAEQQLAAKRKQLMEQNEQMRAKKLKEKVDSAMSSSTVKKEKLIEAKIDGTAAKKESAAPPDFKSIHQKETSKMESIIDFQKRLHQRHMSLSSEQSRLPLAAATTVAAAAKPIGRSPSVSSGIPRISTALPKPHIAPSKENNAAELNAKKIRPNNQSTPKVATVLTAQSSNIPVPTNKVQKVPQKELVVAVAPSPSNLKTPKASKPQTAAPPVNAPTTPTQKSNNVSNVSSSNVMPPQLATSSFIRRKSFDLNASLSRRLGYKPYIGKLKPLEPKPPSVAVGSTIPRSTSSNLNVTKN